MTKYHISPKTGRKEICRARGVCRYDINSLASIATQKASHNLLQAATDGDVSGYLALRAQADEKNSSRLKIAPEPYPVYQMEDEQELWESLREYPGTVVVEGREFVKAPAGESALFCFECHTFLPKGSLAGSSAIAVMCPKCGSRVQSGLAGVGIASDAMKFLDRREVLKSKWFHVSTYPDWDKKMQEFDAPLVHLGTEDAALDRGRDIENHPSHAADFGEPAYIYEIELLPSTPISKHIMEEDGYENSPKTNADAGNPLFEQYEVNGATRYLNHFEAPGSLSLLANPKNFRVISKKPV